MRENSESHFVSTHEPLQFSQGYKKSVSRYRRDIISVYLMSSATKTELLKCVTMWFSLAQSWILSKFRQVCMTEPEGSDDRDTSSHTHTMVLISDEHMSDWRMLSRQ